MKIKTQDSKNLDIADTAFGVPYNEALVHQVVNAVLSGARAGTKAQKNRSAVSGGGAKPWKQKGTGRARAGTIRSPIWVGGGRTFAAKPQDHSQKVNRKMYQAAMRSILSELFRQKRVVVTEKIDIKKPKTKDLLKILNKNDLTDVLLVSDAFDENLFLSARNVKNVGICNAGSITPVILMKHDKILITVPALKLIEERFA
jgi:large subunit ribosomal protein L4|tara:strand:+ start:1611 stop:2213 length:603 start_codon:yes stop_codon:yes gene_type:complete